MSLIEKISADITSAMKAKDKDKLTALRAVKSALLLLQTESSKGGDVSEAEEIQLLQKLVKQRKDSAEIYKTQGRTDLYEVEIKELSYIQVYLPAQMSEAEVEAEIKQIIAETGASSIKDMGKVMGQAGKQLAGKAEGKLIADIVKKLLSN
jgi:uncharacterized protein